MDGIYDRRSKLIVEVPKPYQTVARYLNFLPLRRISSYLKYTYGTVFVKASEFLMCMAHSTSKSGGVNSFPGSDPNLMSKIAKNTPGIRYFDRDTISLSRNGLFASGIPSIEFVKNDVSLPEAKLSSSAPSDDAN